MKTLKNIFLFFFLNLFFVAFLSMSEVKGQCAMCSLNAENGTQHGNTVGKGLNKGVLFLLGMPFFFATGAGVLWYAKFRKKEDRSSIL